MQVNLFSLALKDYMTRDEHALTCRSLSLSIDHTCSNSYLPKNFLPYNRFFSKQETSPQFIYLIVTIYLFIYFILCNKH